MDTEHAFNLFDRTVGRPRPAWLTVLLVFLIYLPALVAAIGTAGVAEVFTHPRLRAVFIAPTIIAYILLIAPVLKRMGTNVIRSLRPVILVSDQELADVIRRSSSVPPLYEAASIVSGLLFGALVINGGPDLPWPIYVEIAMDYLMLGLIGWLAFVSLASTRELKAVLRLPVQVDPLDISPFEAIGRHSLAIALAFVGGNMIALLLGNYGTAALGDPRFWVLFGPLFVLPVAIFFLNMIPTHRLLSQGKERDLCAVQAQLRAAFQSLMECRETGQPAGSLAEEVNALAAYEQHLQQARSWPYNTAILRTLFFSVLVPVVTVLSRRVFELYIR